MIRALTQADRGAFRALRRIALATDPEQFMLTLTEENALPRLHVEAALDDPDEGNFVLGAFAGEALIGIAALESGDLVKIRHVGRIASVFVHPAERRRGLGAGLMTALTERAAAGGRVVTLRLEVVADNQAAVALYRRLGFSIYGREPGAYRWQGRDWDILCMARDLAVDSGRDGRSGEA